MVGAATIVPRAHVAWSRYRGPWLTLGKLVAKVLLRGVLRVPKVPKYLYVRQQSNRCTGPFCS